MVLGLFATSFLWIRTLAKAKPAMAFLPAAGQRIDPMEARIIAALTGTTQVADMQPDKPAKSRDRKVRTS